MAYDQNYLVWQCVRAEKEEEENKCVFRVGWYRVNFPLLPSDKCWSYLAYSTFRWFFMRGDAMQFFSLDNRETICNAFHVRVCMCASVLTISCSTQLVRCAAHIRTSKHTRTHQKTIGNNAKLICICVCCYRKFVDTMIFVFTAAITQCLYIMNFDNCKWMRVKGSAEYE